GALAGRLRRRLSFGRNLHELDVRHALAHAGETIDGHVGEHAGASGLHDLLATARRGPMVASGGCGAPPHPPRPSPHGSHTTTGTPSPGRSTSTATRASPGS